jgi:hypothetical protein
MLRGLWMLGWCIVSLVSMLSGYTGTRRFSTINRRFTQKSEKRNQNQK